MRISVHHFAFSLILLTIPGCSNGANSSQSSTNAGSTNGNSAAISRSAGPEQEQKFCDLIISEPIEAKRLEDEQTEKRNRFPLKQLDEEPGTLIARKKIFDTLYSMIGPEGNFKGWRGSFNASLERPDNPLYHGPVKQFITATFIPDCLMQFQENPVAFHTSGFPPGGTGILLDSPLGQALQQMNFANAQFTVSGQFVWAQLPKGRDPGIARYHFFLMNGVGYPMLVRFTEVSR
jgi:hypothetical protein